MDPRVAGGRAVVEVVEPVRHDPHQRPNCQGRVVGSVRSSWLEERLGEAYS